MKLLQKNSLNQDAANIFRSICEVRERITVLDNHFNNCNDEDLLESCIYELKSLQCKYRFLYRQACKSGIPESEVSGLIKLEG